MLLLVYCCVFVFVCSSVLVLPWLTRSTKNNQPRASEAGALFSLFICLFIYLVVFFKCFFVRSWPDCRVYVLVAVYVFMCFIFVLSFSHTPVFA